MTGVQTCALPISDLELLVEETYTQVPAYRPAPDPESVRQAARHIMQAERPVIVAGGGARLSGAGPEVLELAEKLSIPVATSLAAYALVPEDHPLYIGVPGTYSRECTNRALFEADLVIYVGSKTGGQVTHFWQVPPIGVAAVIPAIGRVIGPRKPKPGLGYGPDVRRHQHRKRRVPRQLARREMGRVRNHLVHEVVPLQAAPRSIPRVDPGDPLSQRCGIDEESDRAGPEHA